MGALEEKIAGNAGVYFDPYDVDITADPYPT